MRILRHSLCTAALAATAFMQSACTIALPLATRSPRTTVDLSDRRLVEGVRVEVRLTNGDRVEGRLRSVREKPAPGYVSAVSAIVQADPSLASVPVPGETVLVTHTGRFPRASRETFLGAGAADVPGIYTLDGDGGRRFHPIGDVAGLHRADGSAVGLAALYRGVREGAIPTLDTPGLSTTTWSIRTNRALVQVSDREIESVKIVRRKGVARIIGLTIAGAVIDVATAAALCAASDCITMDLGGGGTWSWSY